MFSRVHLLKSASEVPLKLYKNMRHMTFIKLSHKIKAKLSLSRRVFNQSPTPQSVL